MNAPRNYSHSPRFNRLLLAAVVFAALATCQILSAKSLDQALDAARAQVRDQLAAKVPGLSVAVAQDGKILWSQGFGFADLDAKTPVTTQTLFRIGSVSKPITAAGLMLLVERGKLDLDADIHKYVPDFPDKGQTITTRQLAGHLAGIRHYRGDEFHLNRHFDNVRQSLVIFENDPLLFQPGEKYSYSSYGWNLISAAMETAAGQDFLGYMQKSVFDPLDLTNTMPDIAGRDLPRRTRFYDPQPGGGFKLSANVDNSYKWASGGFLSNPGDLVRFGSAQLHPGLLKQESLDALFTSQKTSAGQETGYGIGWSIVKSRATGRRVYLHTGGSVGGTSVLILFPDSRVVLALTANCTDAPFDKGAIPALVADFNGVTAPQ